MEKSTFLKKASAIAMAGMMTVSVGQMSIFAETTNSDVNAKDYTYVRKNKNRRCFLYDKN